MYSLHCKDKVYVPLLLANYKSYQSQEEKKLLDEVETFGLSLYRDGASIKTTPFMNIMGAGFKNPGWVLEVVNCSEHMSTANDKHDGKKDAP